MSDEAKPAPSTMPDRAGSAPHALMVSPMVSRFAVLTLAAEPRRAAAAGRGGKRN